MEDDTLTGNWQYLTPAIIHRIFHLFDLTKSIQPYDRYEEKMHREKKIKERTGNSSFPVNKIEYYATQILQKEQVFFLLIPVRCELMHLAAIRGSGELPHTAAAVYEPWSVG